MGEVPSSLRIQILGAMSEVPGDRWDALLAHEADRATPFLRHAFLGALEESGCARARSGWRARHLTLWRGERLVAAAPAYIRDRSDGDFGRDWHWAAALQDAGLPYYPKLVVTVPFTPATGRRFLVAGGEDRAGALRRLVDGLRRVAEEEGARSIHVLFPDEEESAALEGLGFATRVDFQYHWVNAGYRSPDAFLARFSSKRRNALRRERAAPGHQGVEIRTVRGEELAADPGRWARLMFDLHHRSVDRLAWGMLWVNRAFYERALRAMPDALEIVEARRAGDTVAAAFNVVSGTRLYGRYWGCREELPFLHFNVCLYHSIDECIARGLQVFEGGAGGDHKLTRGFEPALTRSAHLFLDARVDRSLRRHLGEERREREAALAGWRADTPVLKPIERSPSRELRPGRRGA
jgi:predicted N-acyltransferase